MGSSHSYKCKKCDKFVIASLRDVTGMYSKVLAVKCNDCNAVGDSTIENHFEFDDEIISIVPLCNECGSKNVLKWDSKCPECANNMVDCGLFMCWD